MAVKSSLRSFIGGKVDSFVTRALRSDVGRKLISMVLGSPLYKSVKDKVDRFRDKRLEELVRSRPLPQHIAVIMDGNRRYARRLGLSEEEGHRLGRNKLQDALDWCLDLGIKVLTVYAFSTENFKRNEREVRSLLNLCREELERASKDSRIHRNQVRVNIIGRLDLLPEELRASAQHIMDATKHYSKYILNIALAYGGRQEIIDALRKIAEDVKGNKLSIKDINEKTVSSYLYTKDVPDPDLIFRTSGEERISNFLLWQLAYSELYFSDVYWPALRKRDFLRAIHTYQQRKRKFGR